MLEVGVIGVPSEKSGEVPKRLWYVKTKTSPNKTAAIRAKRINGYKRPRKVEFVDELPKSDVGKILRKELRKLEEKVS